MAFGKLARFTTKTALGGGTIYYYYSTGLWRDSETAIRNYEVLRKDAIGFYESNPPIVRIVETGQSHLSSTIAPAVDAVTDFKKEWLDFDLYWLGSGDGIIKPTWNKSISWICDFLAHAPEDLRFVAGLGWEKLSDYASESGSATATAKTK